MSEPRPKAARILQSARRPAGSGSPLRLDSPLLWDLLLAVLTAVWSLLFIRLFYPGRVNVDIAEQYLQATGEHPFTDWHPPVMGVLWRGLLALTGEAGSLLVLQVGLLAVASWLIGVLVHRTGAPRWVSLLGPAIMITPWVVSQMTTLWKDTQMAVALLLGAVLIVITRFAPKTWPLWFPALALLVYAVAVRKNAVFAVVPIAVFGGYCLLGLWREHRRLGHRQRRAGRRDRPFLPIAVMSLVVLALIGGGVKVTEAAIASQVEVEKTGQISQIMLDDVMFSVSDAELMAADAPTELKEHISSARDRCLEKNEIWDSYWNCYGKGESGEDFSPIAYQDELRQLWLHEVITHPLRYVEYRTAVFSHYFFTSALEYWPAEWHGEAEKAGIEPGNAKADYIVRPYVEDFALGTFPMLFTPWFWTLVAVWLLGLGWCKYKKRRQSVEERASATRARSFWPEITALATSALCYVIGYFPIVPANHFRYTFWPALAVSAAMVLALAMWRRGAGVPLSNMSGPASSECET
ncbi:hypothetical protein [Brevibacterium renqingii]|uniref:hypothetical protein n=1 Tax=Brevibacterium renqingii TaxID=2776916 RepID=UPI001AE0D10C|nr:hypothetical protein [Brevibacterium renqingii]